MSHFTRMKLCVACLLHLERLDFSKKQWNDKSNLRRCLDCVSRAVPPSSAADFVLRIAHLPCGPQTLITEYCSDASSVSGFMLGMACSAHAAATYAGVDADDVLCSPSFALSMKTFEKALIKDTNIERVISELRAEVCALKKTLVHTQDQMQTSLMAQGEFYRSKLRDERTEATLQLNRERDTFLQQLKDQQSRAKRKKKKAIKSALGCVCSACDTKYKHGLYFEDLSESSEEECLWVD